MNDPAPGHMEPARIEVQVDGDRLRVTIDATLGDVPRRVTLFC